jgi:Zn-dependent peptidase ImmA (M78 family)/predicted secreted protein
VNTRQAHLTAIKEATRAHQLLSVDASHQIDPFEAIARAGVTVAVVPLNNLSGAYIPAMPETDGRPGILVNAKHPRTRQRFTAAHELCHHLRDKDPILDGETEVLARSGTPPSDAEAIAEAFAGWFLMPRRLVEKLWSDLGIPTDPSPEGVYRLSLELGTSYSATLAHLVSLGRISRPSWQRLAKLPPKWIKQQLAVHGPGDSWGDVWLVTDRDRGQRHITPRPGDEIVIELDEMPSSGYMWGPPEGGGFEVAESSFEQDGEDDPLDPIVGGNGRRRVVLRATRPGDYRLEMEMRRPWLPTDEPIRKFALDLSVQRPPLGYAPLAAAV